MKTLDFTLDQRYRLWELLETVAPSRRNFLYSIIGIEDVADRPAAVDFVRSLQRGDWQAASQHHALAGTNTLLVAVLLRTASDPASAWWALLRSPFDPWERASLETHGSVLNPAELSRHFRWSPLEYMPDKARAN